MTASDLLDLAERALSRSRRPSQVTVLHERSLLSRFARSTPTQATEIDALEICFLTVVDGHLGRSSTSSIADADLAAAAARAAAQAETAARSGPGTFPGLPDPEPSRPHQGWDPATAQPDPGMAGSALARAFDVADGAALEAFGIWTAGGVETAIASSTGIHERDAVSDAHFKVIQRGPGGRTGYAAQTASRAADLDVDAASRRAAAKVVPVEPVELEPGEYAVVLDADAVGVLLDFVGALAFNGLAFAEERSQLSGRLGQRVTASCINLADSPRFGMTLPRRFDAEGVPKAPLPLVQDGVAHRVVHDTHSAGIAGNGARSTGHALQPGGAPDGPAPINLVLVGGGAADEHELAAPIERGLYVTRFWYVNPVAPKQTLLTGMSRDGTFLIEDGRIGRPLRDVRFTDSGLGVLGAAEALGSRPRLVSEGDFYGRRFATGVVCPPLRASHFRVTGTAPG
jgi:predicted Zn-dependent protease